MTGRILMPVLPSREQGRVSRWLVREGQTIAPGDVIAEVETASATLEIEASGEGRIERILIGAGSGPLAAGTLLALLSEVPAAPALAPSPAREPPRASHGGAPAIAEILPPRAPSGAVRTISYREALRDALAEEMRRDERVFVIGVDAGQNRGAPEVTQGLLDAFGPRRVVSVPALEGATAARAAVIARAAPSPPGAGAVTWWASADAPYPSNSA
jgi:pyruvate dehydrogenase E1 component beta subunit